MEEYGWLVVTTTLAVYFLLTISCALVAREVIPGPECASDKDIQDYMKKFLGTTFRMSSIK